MIHRWHGARMAAMAIAVGMSLPMSAAVAKTYQNLNFGLIIQLPPDLHQCRPEVQNYVHGQSHGMTAFLDPKDSQICGDPERRRAIDVSGWYNVFDDTRTLADYKRSKCHDLGQEHCAPAPEGLRIAKSRSASFRIDTADGLIMIIVLTQAGHGSIRYPEDPEFDVNYDARLYTDQAHLENDLSRFRKFLQAIRLVDPP